MPAIFFALISFVGWGIGDLFVTISTRKLNAYSATFWSYLTSALLMSAYVPFVLGSLKQLTPEIFFLNILLGFTLMCGIISYREGLIRGSSPIIVTIATAASVVTTVLSIIFFKEQLSSSQILSIMLIFSGITLSVLDLKLLIKRKVKLEQGVVFALIAMVLWGIYFTFIKIPVQKIGWFWPNYFSFLFFAPLVFGYIKFKNIKLLNLTYNKAFWPLFISIIFARGAELSFNLAIAKGYTSIVAPIAGAYPTLFVILAFLFLKDPITKQQILGIFTTLIGIVLLSVFSV